MNRILQKAATPALLTVAGIVFVLGAWGLTSGLMNYSELAPEAEVATAREALEADLATAQSELAQAHDELQAKLEIRLPAERQTADQTVAESLANVVADMAGSSLDDGHLRALLSAQYSFLPETSPVLTTFLPSWRADATVTQLITDLQVQPIAWDSKNKVASYLAFVTFSPAVPSADGDPAAEEHRIFLNFTTNADGDVSRVRAETLG